MKRHINIQVDIWETPESTQEKVPERSICQINESGVVMQNAVWVTNITPDDHFFIIMRFYQEWKDLQERFK